MLKGKALLLFVSLQVVHEFANGLCIFSPQDRAMGCSFLEDKLTFPFSSISCPSANVAKNMNSIKTS